jgi:hypothetical protein
MIFNPGDRCACRFPDGRTMKCTVLRGPIPPPSAAPPKHRVMSTAPYRYEVRFDDCHVETVGEARLTHTPADGEYATEVNR